MIAEHKIRELAYSSIEYRADRAKDDGHSIMVIREYFDPRVEIRIDLAKLTPEILEQLAPDVEDEDAC